MGGNGSYTYVFPNRTRSPLCACTAGDQNWVGSDDWYEEWSAYADGDIQDAFDVYYEVGVLYPNTDLRSLPVVGGNIASFNKFQLFRSLLIAS